MGIPSYFSHIMKTYSISMKRIPTSRSINYVFLDSNSVIYNVIYRLTPTDLVSNSIIFREIGRELEEILKQIEPTKMAMICFDGVAPFAKMKQQRERRFRSSILRRSSSSPFDTCSITPGTPFMNDLSSWIKHYFEKTKRDSFSYKVIVSGSDEPGEGEHKIFEYIRNHSVNMQNESVCIHGLDADLIILSLQHQQYVRSLILYRDSTCLDIDKLSDCIFHELSYFKTNKHNLKHRIIHDYVLLSFFLGNDFLPHFPCLNIRHKGISHLFHAYYQTISSKGLFLTSANKDILWYNLKQMISFLASMEESYMKEEHQHILTFKPKRMKEEDRIPYRHGESFINPYKSEWKIRYYRRLFRDTYHPNISISYIRGLQWCLHYYNGIIIDPMYCYKYNYAPLFSDIVQHIPERNCSLFPPQEKQPTFFSPLEQLSYVLPPSSYSLLPDSIRKKMEQENTCVGSDAYIPLQWDYCTYLWEAHPLIPHLSMRKISNIVLEETYNE